MVEASPWNESPLRKLQLFGTLYSFVLMGMNDATIGPLIPWLESYYDISYGTISYAFLAPVLGYVSSAMINDTVHVHLGHRGIALLSSGSRFVAYFLICLHPPFPWLVVTLVLAGAGNGLSDGAWNAWVGGMAHANELLGVLHGFYGIGGMLAPAIATTLVAKLGWQWFQFYYLLAAFAFTETSLLTAAFWKSDGAHYRATHGITEPNAAPDGERGAGATAADADGADETTGLLSGTSQAAPAVKKATLKEVMKSRVTWTCSIFLVAYVGVEVALGGWIPTFMLRVRHASSFASGMAATLFWTGITVGRVVLGFVTPRAFPSVKEAVTAYLLAAVGSQLVFWTIDHFVVSLVAIFWLGFALAPLFPAAIVAATGLLDSHMHVAAIGFMSSLGAAGATFAPFLVGAVADLAGGVRVMQPVVLAFLLTCLGVWLTLPSLTRKR
ncbi:hypothetical protein KEM52_001817 [Ascosphaera acerosa]|nr:hypothetical protein KEM52_001817 [Ascosphaera acerosa]